jgi:hypothetical protein
MDCPTCNGHGDLNWMDYKSEDTSDKSLKENENHQDMGIAVSICNRCGGSGLLEQY